MELIESHSEDNKQAMGVPNRFLEFSVSDNNNNNNGCF